jgi:hypothetical protein
MGVLSVSNKLPFGAGAIRLQSESNKARKYLISLLPIKAKLEERSFQKKRKALV